VLGYWVDQLDPFLVHFGGRFGVRYYGLAYARLPRLRVASQPLREGRPLTPAESKLGDFMVAAVFGSSSAAGSGPTSSTTGGARSARIPWRSSGSGTAACRSTEAWSASSSRSHGSRAQAESPWSTSGTRGLDGVRRDPLGRIANFWNGELWGRVTSVPGLSYSRGAPTPADRPGPAPPSLAALRGLMEGRSSSPMSSGASGGRTQSASTRARLRGIPGRLAVLRIAGEGSGSRTRPSSWAQPRHVYSLFMIAFGLYLRQRRADPLPAPAPRLDDRPRGMSAPFGPRDPVPDDDRAAA